jgi:hypothetical protein
MDSVELELHAGVTRAFILADAEDLTLTRRTKVSDGAGGFTFAEIELAPQTFRILPQTDQVPEIQLPNGRLGMPEWVLLGDSESDMERYDRFTWRGMSWEIAQVHSKPDYEKKGDVVRVG